MSSEWVQRSKSSYRVRAPGSANTQDPSGLGCSSEIVSAFRMFKWETRLGSGPENPISERERERHKKHKGKSQQKEVRTSDTKTLGDTRREPGG